MDEAALRAHRLRDTRLNEEHIAAAKELVGTVDIEHRARVDF